MNKILLMMFVLLVIAIALWLWKHYSYTAGYKNIDHNKSIETVWQEYRAYWLKHEPTMTAPATCQANSHEEVEALEKVLEVQLPDDLKKSLQLVDHRRKKCDDNLVHSWFGSRTGISLYDVERLKIINLDMQKNPSFHDRDYNAYWGDIAPVTGRYWPKEWLVIAGKYNVLIFIDLRKNIGNQYGQVLAYMTTYEGGKNAVLPPKEVLAKIPNYYPDSNNAFNNFVFVANDYNGFMQLMLEEIKANGELKDRYFLHLFNLPLHYFW